MQSPSLQHRIKWLAIEGGRCLGDWRVPGLAGVVEGAEADAGRDVVDVRSLVHDACGVAAQLEQHLGPPRASLESEAHLLAARHVPHTNANNVGEHTAKGTVALWGGGGVAYLPVKERTWILGSVESFLASSSLHGRMEKA
jgi:hypothetical protein